MLVEAGGTSSVIEEAARTAGGLGLFIRSLVGLDRAVAVEKVGEDFNGSGWLCRCPRFVTLIIDDLTANGSMEPARLFESPFTDQAPTGPDYVYPDPDITVIVETLQHIKRTASPEEGRRDSSVVA